MKSLKLVLLLLLKILALVFNFHFVIGYYLKTKDKIVKSFFITVYLLGGGLFYFIMYSFNQNFKLIFDNITFTYYDFIFLYIFEIILLLTGLVFAYLSKQIGFHNRFFYTGFVMTFIASLLYFNVLNYPSIFDILSVFSYSIENANEYEKGLFRKIFG